MNRKIIILWAQKIPNLLHINLDKRCLHSEFKLRRGILNPLEYSFSKSWCETFTGFIINITAHHCIRFTTGRLTITEQCRIETIETLINKRETTKLKDLPLLRATIKYVVKSKVTRKFIPNNLDGCTVTTNFHYLLAILTLLQLILRPKSTNIKVEILQIG